MLHITLRQKARQFGKLVRQSAVQRCIGQPKRPALVQEGELGITFLGHAGFLVQIGGKNIVIDPNFARWLFVLKRLRRPGVLIHDLPPIDYVLVTHAHFDHLNRPSLRAIARRTRRLTGQRPTIIVPPHVSDLVRGLGYGRVIELQWWQEHSEAGLRITATPANHWGARMIHDSHRGFGGYVLKTDRHSVYHAGDTAYFEGFRAIGQRLAPEIALLPIGAYDPPSFRNVHSSPEDAVQGFLDLGARILIPMHYGTFKLSHEPIEEPVQRLRAAAAATQLQDSMRILGEGATAHFAYRQQDSGHSHPFHQQLSFTSESESMNVLVPGGAGYIGSVVTAELLKAGHQVTVFDNLSKGKRQAVSARADLVVGDIADRAALSRVFRSKRFDAVMNFAAFIEAGESMKAPEQFFRNNTANALTLLETMLEHGVRKFVFSSTAALFGDPERTPIQENDGLEPTNAYGESMLLVELMLAWFHRIHGFRYASLRYFNAAGATESLGEAHEPESHLIPLVLQVAMGKCDKIQIFGTDYPTPDGTCIRDYIHVVDLADAHVLALHALGQHSRLIYNLGNGRGFSVREVIEAARRVTGHPIPAVESPRRPGDPAILVAGSEKIMRELGWKPRYAELETIIRSAWEWHRKNPDGYQEQVAEATTSTPLAF
jgi:UDP-glucose 4-epimerase